jgi:hypothetical protein
VEFVFVLPVFILLLLGGLDVTCTVIGVGSFQSGLSASGQLLASGYSGSPGCSLPPYDQGADPQQTGELCEVINRIGLPFGLDASTMEVAINCGGGTAVGCASGDRLFVCAQISEHSVTGILSPVLHSTITRSLSWVVTQAPPNFEDYPSAGSPPTAFPQTCGWDAPSSLTSNCPAGNWTLTAGSYFTCTFTAAGTPPPLFYADGLPNDVYILPNGVLVDNNSNAVGTYPVTIGASNGVGAGATESFTLTIPGVPPEFTNGDDPGNTTGDVTFTPSNGFNAPVDSYTFTASGAPAPTFSAAGLPNGVTLGANSGVLTYDGPEPASDTSYVFTVTASNSSGTASQLFTLTIDSPPPSG